jgi:hypothetical protein
MTHEAGGGAVPAATIDGSLRRAQRRRPARHNGIAKSDSDDPSGVWVVWHYRAVRAVRHAGLTEHLEIAVSGRSRGQEDAMKAMTRTVYGSADVLESADVQTPTAADDEVLIRVRAAGAGPDPGPPGCKSPRLASSTDATARARPRPCRWLGHCSRPRGRRPWVAG